jgi:hypothetical protein
MIKAPNNNGNALPVTTYLKYQGKGLAITIQGGSLERHIRDLTNLEYFRRYVAKGFSKN